MKRWFRKIKRWIFGEPKVQPSLPPVEQDIVVPDIPAEVEDILLTNEAGLKLCSESEGLHRLDKATKQVYPYLDPVGIPTIGRGTVRYPDGRKVTMRDLPITIDDADEYFKHEMNEKENIIEKHLLKHNIKLTSNEFSALVSFAYNLGEGAVISYPNYSMSRAVMSQDREAIGKAFLLYDKATKTFFGIPRKVRLPGLTIRRKKERALFLTKQV